MQTWNPYDFLAGYKTVKVRAAADGVARDRGHPQSAALAAHQGQGAAPGRRRRRRARRDQRPAEDGAEAVEVDYAELAGVVDMAAAIADGAPIVHDEFGTNSCYVWKLTNGEASTRCLTRPRSSSRSAS